MEKNNVIAAVDRALDILMYIYQKGKPVRISDISRDMDVYKSTIYRELYTLEQKGFVKKSEKDDTYWLGMKLYTLGLAVQENMNLSELSQLYMQELNQKYHEVVYLSTIDFSIGQKPQMLVIYKVDEVMRTIKADPVVGKYDDCHCSAAGKCLLAFSEEYAKSEMKEFPLKKYTKNTIADWNEFVKVLQQTKENKYALDEEEWEEGLTCIGVPILERNGKAIAALSMAGPTTRMCNQMEDKIRDLQKAGQEISRNFK